MALGENKLGSRLGRYQELGHFPEPAYFLGLVRGPTRLFLNPISCPPALGYGERGQGLFRFLNKVRLPCGHSGLGWLGLCRRQTSCDNDDFSTFELIFSSSFSSFENILLPLVLCPPPPPPPPDIEAFYFSASSAFVRLTIYSESLLAFCDTLLGVALFRYVPRTGVSFFLLCLFE